jgi:hypothetical protein
LNPRLGAKMKNVHLSFPMISRNNSVLGLKITTIVAAAHARTTKAFRSRKNRDNKK